MTTRDSVESRIAMVRGGGLLWPARCQVALSVIHDLASRTHPSYVAIEKAMATGWAGTMSEACGGFLAIYDASGFGNLKLKTAAEIEDDLLDFANTQLARSVEDAGNAPIHLAIAAFMAGAILEDSLRRLVDVRIGGSAYDPTRSTLNTLASLLYQPGNETEHIDRKDFKNIGTWGETRNNADHGHFSKLTEPDVRAMVIGIRGFIEKHLK